MKIILSESTEEAVKVVASMVLELVSSNPSSVVGLATGRTMEPVYSEIVKEAAKLDFSKCFFFMLDEYLGLAPAHPSSFRSYVENHLMTPLKLDPTQFAFHSNKLTPSQDAANYEELLSESGIDLQLLGVGQNGHIGFNEPGSKKDSRTREVHLTEETIKANQIQFPNGDMPKRAISMGIASIMDAKSIVLLATGKSKADAIKYLLNHHDDPSCPVTYLKSHPHFTLVLDPEAASKISLKI